MDEHPDMPPGLLLRSHEAQLPVELVGLLEEQLPRLDTQQIRYDMDEREGRRAGHDGRGDLGYRHDDVDGPGVLGEGPEVYEVGGPTEDYEGAELEEHPSVGEGCRLLGEVDQLEWDGEVGEGYEEVRDVLVLDEELVSSPELLDAGTALHLVNLEPGCLTIECRCCLLVFLACTCSLCPDNCTFLVLLSLLTNEFGTLSFLCSNLSLCD